MLTTKVYRKEVLSVQNRRPRNFFFFADSLSLSLECSLWIHDAVCIESNTLFGSCAPVAVLFPEELVQSTTGKASRDCWTTTSTTTNTWAPPSLLSSFQPSTPGSSNLSSSHHGRYVFYVFYVLFLFLFLLQIWKLQMAHLLRRWKKNSYNNVSFVCGFHGSCCSWICNCWQRRKCGWWQCLACSWCAGQEGTLRQCTYEVCVPGNSSCSNISSTSGFHTNRSKLHSSCLSCVQSHWWRSCCQQSCKHSNPHHQSFPIPVFLQNCPSNPSMYVQTYPWSVFLFWYVHSLFFLVCVFLGASGWWFSSLSMLLQTYVAITQAIKEVQSGGAGAGRVDYQVSSTPTIPLKAIVVFCDSAREAADLYWIG